MYTLSRNSGFGTPIGDRADGRLLFARSMDGGNTFTETVLADAHDNTFLFGTPQLAELDDGTLVATSTLPDSLGGGTRSYRSVDHGATWSSPGAPQPSIDEGAELQECGAPVLFEGDTGQYAVLHGHTLLAVKTVNETPQGPARAYLLRSENGGQTWTASVTYRSPLPLGLASVATDRAGRIGMVFDQIDAANVNCSPSPTIPARSSFVVSNDEGRSWS